MQVRLFIVDTTRLENIFSVLDVISSTISYEMVLVHCVQRNGKKKRVLFGQKLLNINVWRKFFAYLRFLS